MSNLDYRRLKANYSFHKLIDITNDLDGNYDERNMIYIYSYFYRIEAFIQLGEFNKAEELCYEVLSKGTNKKMLNNTYVFLANIYYFKEEYIKCLFFRKLDYNNDAKKTSDIKIILSDIAYQNNKDLYGSMHYVDKNILKYHIQLRHREAFNKKVNFIIDLVKRYYYETRAYYDNFSVYHIFRCHDVGLSNYKDSSISCDYIKVVSRKNDPNTILTIFPITSPGDLEYFDLTDAYYKECKHPKKSNGKTLARFNKRQNKKHD